MKRSLIALLLFPSLAFGSVVRVGLFQKELPTEFTVSSKAGLVVRNSETGGAVLNLSSNEPLAIRKVNDHIEFGSRNSSPVKKLSVEPAERNATIDIVTPSGKTREVAGSLEIVSREHELLAINLVDEEQYVAGVLSGEMPASWPSEALRAQAVLVRTFLERNRNRHKEEGYDVCDITHCQVYSGVNRSSEVNSPVEATRGEILSYCGQPADVMFHSTCGGATTSNHSVWPSAEERPYLRGGPDGEPSFPYCRTSPYFEWTLRAPRADVNRIASSAIKTRNKVNGISAGNRDVSGRLKTLNVETDNGPLEISADDFYRAWGRQRGWNELKSTRFEINAEGDSYKITGKGLGHGVGLCQYGAKVRAEGGARYQEILEAYFPGTTLIQQK